MTCELGPLQGPSTHGSALWSTGSDASLQVLASVHGPVAPRLPHHEDAHAAHVSVLVHLPSATTALPRDIEHWLAQVLRPCIDIQRYPRTVIQIVVHVLAMRSGGSVRAACVHAATMALMDAGIALLDIPCAVSVGVHRPKMANNTAQPLALCLDPSLGDWENYNNNNQNNNNSIKSTDDNDDMPGMVFVALASAPESVLAGHSQGRLSLTCDDWLQCQAVVARAMPAVHAFMRVVMEQKTTRQSQTLWSGHV
jgi:hypothetical protein